MKVLVFANSKGGVGKTTCAVLVAEGLATFHSQRVLCIDVDPQNNMTTLVMGEAAREQLKNRSFTIDQYFLGAINAQHATLSRYIFRPEGRLNLANIKKPGSISAIAAAQRLIDTEHLIVRRDPRREVPAIRNNIVRQFEQDLAALAKDYDVVIFDTPPTLNLFTEIALLVCDFLIIPHVPEELSTMGLPELIGRANKTQLLSSEARDHVLILPSRYNKKWFSHGTTMQKLNGFASALASQNRIRIRVLDQQVLLHEDFAMTANKRDENLTFDQKYGRAKANAKAVVKTVWQAIS